VLVKARVRPSGDHTGALAPLGKSVIARASPPARSIRWICGGCGLPSFSAARRKASRRPSGDQRGAVSRGPLVNGRGAVEPSVGTIQSAVSYPSFFLLTATRTNATSAPSGEICGSPIHTNRNRSVSVIARRSGAGPAWGAARTRARAKIDIMKSASGKAPSYRGWAATV